MSTTKVRSSHNRRLLIAYLIETGVNTVPELSKITGIPNRSIQNTIKSLGDVDIIVQFTGSPRTGCYVLKDWGCVNKDWIIQNLEYIKLQINTN